MDKENQLGLDSLNNTGSGLTEVPWGTQQGTELNESPWFEPQKPAQASQPKPAQPAKQGQPAQPGSARDSVSNPYQQRGAISSARLDAIAQREGLTPEQARIWKQGILAQESGQGANSKTSVDGARGAGQVMPGTFRAFAKPGEQIDDDEANLAVSARIVKDLATKFNNNPARVAVGYFSGEGNVNKEGAQPWKRDHADGNGKRTSDYANDIINRLNSAPAEQPTTQTAKTEAVPEPDVSKIPKWADITAKPEFQQLTPEKQAEAKEAYFDYYIAPIAGNEANSLREEFIASTPAAKPGKSLLTKAGEVASDVASAIKNGIGNAAGAALDTEAGNPPAAKVNKGSVMADGGQTTPPPASFAPVKPEIRKALESRWDAATPQERKVMESTPGWVGDILRARAAGFKRQDNAARDPLASMQMRAQLEAAWDAAPPEERARLEALPGWQGDIFRQKASGLFALGLDQAPNVPGTSPTVNKVDPRVEARRSELILKGEDPRFAEVAAEAGARRGVLPGQELSALPTIEKSDYDFETQKLLDPNARPNGLNNALVRGVIKGASDMYKFSAGINEFVFDALGADEIAGGIRKQSDWLRAKDQVMGEGGALKNVEGAIRSITGQIPFFASGSEPLALGGMAMSVFGQEYSDGRAKGQSFGEATTRASLYAIAEVIGEKFSIGANMKAYRALLDKTATDQLPKLLGEILAKEIPGEALTTALEFGIDKLPDGIGLDPKAGWAEFAQQQADTFVQTVIQSGLMGGAPMARAHLSDKGQMTERRLAELRAMAAQDQALAKWEQFRQSIRPTEPTMQGEAPAPSSVDAYGRTEPSMAPAPQRNIMPDGRIEPDLNAPATTDITPDGRIEPGQNDTGGTVTVTVRNEDGTTTTGSAGNNPVEATPEPQANAVHPVVADADRIVSGLADQAGIPQSTVLPSAPSPMTGQVEPRTDADLANFAEARSAQLWQKMTEGNGLTVSEQQELAALRLADGDPAALRSLYGGGNAATQASTSTMEPGLVAAQEKANESQNETQGNGPASSGAQEAAGGSNGQPGGPAAVAQPAADAAGAQGGAQAGQRYDGLPAENAVIDPEAQAEREAIQAEGTMAVQTPDDSDIPFDTTPPKNEKEAKARRTQTEGEVDALMATVPNGGFGPQKVWDASERKLIRKLIANIIDKGVAAGKSNEEILAQIHNSTQDALGGLSVNKIDQLITEKRNGTQTPEAKQTEAQGSEQGAGRQQVKADEPPLAPGMTRLYHGSATKGRYDGKAWFSTNRDYAANYRDGAELQYVDVPTERINKLADPDNYGQTPGKGFTFNGEFDSSDVGVRKPLIAKPKTEKEAKERRETEGKWFGTKEKADAFLAKNGLTSTHEAVKNGAKFEIKVKQGIRETITPDEDTQIGVNSSGEPLYERKDGSRYRMSNGKPNFGGDLASVENLKSSSIDGDATLDTPPTIEEVKAEKPATETEARKAKAQADLDAALGDLGDIFGKGSRLNVTPEQEQKILPVLTRVMDAAFRLGYYKFKDAARFVVKTIREKLGDDVADQITLDHLQGAYIGMAGRYQDQGASSKKDVVSVESLDELGEEATDKTEPTKFTALDLYTSEGKMKVAQELADFFIGGGSFANIVEARKKISEMIGKPIKAATELAKQADETIEVAVVLAGREIVQAGRKQGRSTQIIYDRLVDLYKRQPNLAVRSSTSVRDQAYSTPVPLAYLASELAGITYESKVLEPTAGNGMLLIGADTKNATANELNGKRAAMLDKIGFKSEQKNAATESLAPAKSQDAVIANPPFGATKDDAGNTIIYEIKPDYGTREVDHAIAFKALETMKDDGRAVLIVGGVQAEGDDARREDYRGKSKRSFYFNLYKDYNVVDHFTADGSLYSKQGASYPVDIIVIEGRGQSSRDLPAADLPKIYGSYEELKEKLNGTRSVESRGVSGADGAAGGDAAAGAGDKGAMVGGTGRPGNEDGAEGRRASRGDGVPGAGRSDDRGALPSGTVTGSAQSNADEQLEFKPKRRQPVSSNSGRAGSGSEGSTGKRDVDGLGRSSIVSGERVQSGLTDRRGEETETENQVSYAPKSGATSVGTLVPKAMRDSIQSSLDKIEEQFGNIDDYVAERLNYDPETLRANFSAEQVDALALAIKNAEEGRGFIIGDQTGIGKGRVVAAMIRYALVNDKIPIFVTEKPNLYADMIRDLDAIGMADELGLESVNPKILITNGGESIPYTLVRKKDGNVTESVMTLKSPKSSQAMPALMKKMAEENSLGEYKVIFTTYSQIQPLGGVTERMRFVEHFADGNYVIFDESHNAGGGGEKQARNKDQRKAQKEGESLVTGRAAFARKIVNKAYGTFFSSATYAKRPDVMDLYSSTNMKLAVDKISQLATAIKLGGVPMQQVVATMLTQDGQYIRRERTFAGVSYDTVEAKVDRQAAENMAAAMRSILAFSRAKEAVIKAIQKEMDKEGAIVKQMGGETSTIQGANFGSIMHNLIDQMLLSLKAEESVAHAIARVKAGEKVVLTVSNTMESFLDKYSEEMGLNTGDAIALSFKDLYERYLEKQRVVSIKDGSGKTSQRRLTDAELGQQLVAQFNAIRKQISEAGFGSTPISPIDYIHDRLRKADLKTDEITGREAIVNYQSGTPILSKRKKDIKQRLAAIKGFNDGTIDVLILNQSGSTGISLHASSEFKDQRKRHMIIVQAEKNIDTHMQMLGRVHRTGQIIPPSYSQMMADIPAEMRPASVLMKKMASLNANTTASRKSSVTAEGVVDFMNDYGGQVVQEFLRDNPDVLEAIGGNKVVPLIDDSSEASEDDIRKFTGYVPILPIKQQEVIYKDLIDRYNELIERENTLGTNKLEAKAIDLDAQTLSSVQITEDKGDPSIFASPANMEQVDVKRNVKPFASAEVTTMVNDRLGDKTAGAIANEMERALTEKAQAFAKERIAKLEADGADPVRIDNQKSQFNLIWSHTKTVLQTYKIGDSISVKDKVGQIIYGVITDITSAGRTANPAAGSDWKMQIALANGDAKTLTLNFSQVGNRYELAQQNTVNWYNAETQQAEQMPVLEIFDKGSTVRREKRWMVTGNILSGFAKYPGQIIQYTKKDGTTGQGVLMSRQFDFAKEQANAPTTIKDSSAAMTFFNAIGDGATIGTPDGVLRLQLRNGRFIAVVPSAKREGGTYFLDKGLTDALGTDFYKRGSQMVANTYDTEAAKATIDYIINDLGEKLVALSHTDKAKELLGPKPNTAEGGVTLNDIPSNLAENDLFTNLPEPERVNALQRLKALEKKAAAGKITEAEYRLAIAQLISQLQRRADNARDNNGELVRGPDWVKERLLRARRNGELPSDVVDFALWLLDKNPNLANGLAISLPAGGANNPSGSYKSLLRLMTLYKNNTNTGTAVHEIMHHAERMMPREMQKGIVGEWQRAWDKAYRKGNEATRKALLDLLHGGLGNGERFKSAVQAFKDGTLNYDDHYQLTSPSEYWAVNATRILGERHHATTWQAKAKQFLREMFEYLKGLFKFPSDAPILKALRQVLNGDGQEISKKMLVERITDKVDTVNAINQNQNNPQANIPLNGGQNGATWNVDDTSRMDRFIEEIQDRHVNLKRVQQAIKEVTSIPEQFDAYQKEELYHGRVAARTHKFLDREIKPLLMDMKLKGITMDELEAYLWARHAPERNAQIAKINPKMPDGGSGLTNAEVSAYMAGNDVLDSNGNIVIKGMKLADQRRLEALAARVDAITLGTKQVLTQYGLEDLSTIQAWDATYKHYVPLHREDMEGATPIGQGYSVKGSASRRAMGSKRKVTDILAHLALQREAAITRGEKNRVGVALYGLALQNPNADFWEVDKVPMVNHIDKNTGLVVQIPDPTYKNQDNTLVVRIGGKDRAIIFNKRDERAMRMVIQLKNLDINNFGEIMGAIATTTRFFASINTQYNPVFGLINGLRDVQSAALNLSNTALAGKQAQVLAAVPGAMRAIWKIERYGKANNQYDAMYEAMELAGGTTGYREIFRMGADRAKALQKEIDSLNAGRAKKVATYLLDWLDHYNTAIENGTRLAAYKVAQDMGMSQEQAASVAKNITVNFNRKGKIAREAGAFYAFFNAAVQGSARTIETLRAPAGKRIIMGGVALGIIQVLIAIAAMDDDEWDDIPEFIKQRNFIIPVGNKNYIQVPMPLGFNVLPNIGRIVTELAYTKGKHAGQKTLDLLAVFLDNANPLGSSTLAQMLSPTITDPIVALAENKDFSGRTIYKKDVSPLNETPGFTRSRDSSSTVSRLLSKGINAVTGGTKYTPGLLSPTTDQIDYIFGTLTGGIGRELNKVYQTGELMANGEDVPEYKKPVLGRFFGSTDEDVTVTARYYRNIKEMNALEQEIKGRRKDKVDSTGFKNENPESSMIHKSNRVEKRINDKLHKRHAVEFDEKLTENERTAKLKEIDDDIQARMRRFNEAVSKAKNGGAKNESKDDEE